MASTASSSCCQNRFKDGRLGVERFRGNAASTEKVSFPFARSRVKCISISNGRRKRTMLENQERMRRTMMAQQMAMARDRVNWCALSFAHSSLLCSTFCDSGWRAFGVQVWVERSLFRVASFCERFEFFHSCARRYCGDIARSQISTSGWYVNSKHLIFVSLFERLSRDRRPSSLSDICCTAAPFLAYSVVLAYQWDFAYGKKAGHDRIRRQTRPLTRARAAQKESTSRFKASSTTSSIGSCHSMQAVRLDRR